MNELLEIVHITLISISKAVYNYWFLIIVFILYFLIKKIQGTNIYNFENSKPPIWSLVEAVLQGIIVGIAGSLVIIILGIPINLSIYIIYLLPISIMLSMIKIRYICISYSAAVIGVLALIFNGQKIFNFKLPNININIAGLIALVGILHLMESILIFFVGADNCMPIICKKDGKIVQGHVLQKYWPIPLAMLFVTSGTASGSTIQMPYWWPLLKTHPISMESIFFGLMPLIGVLGYSSITFTEQPEKRAKKTGLMLFLYSLFIIIIAIIAKDNWILNLIGLVLMAALHEAIMLFEQYYERHSQPIFTLPDKGIRIMHVIEGGAAKKAGMKNGQVIKKINDFEVINSRHFKELMENKWTFLWIEVEGLKKESKTYEIKAYPNGLDNLGIKILPETPRILFKYENIKRIGMIDLLKNIFIKK